MKQRITAILVLAALLPFLTGANIVIRGPVVASAGGGLAAFSDDFNRADGTSIGADYTELVGTAWAIYSNHLESQAGGFTWTGIVNSGNPVNTVNQYGKVSVADPSGIAWMSFIFRYTNSSSAFYEVVFDTNLAEIRWRHWTAVGGTATTIATTAHTVSYPETFGVTVTGTGTGTVVKVWIDPTGLPSGWGAATYTFTDDPASAVDTGLICGLGAASSTNPIFDDWYWGDAP